MSQRPQQVNKRPTRVVSTQMTRVGNSRSSINFYYTMIASSRKALSVLREKFKIQILCTIVTGTYSFTSPLIFSTRIFQLTLLIFRHSHFSYNMANQQSANFPCENTKITIHSTHHHFRKNHFVDAKFQQKVCPTCIAADNETFGVLFKYEYTHSSTFQGQENAPVQQKKFYVAVVSQTLRYFTPEKDNGKITKLINLQLHLETSRNENLSRSDTRTNM